MSDRFDVHLRKTEIAWELAQAALEIDRDPDKIVRINSAQFLEKATKHLRTAWTLVDELFPTEPPGV